MSDTGMEILLCARELLQQRGFNAFSYQDIADRLGIKKASIHYHFPSKTDLGVALIEAMRAEFGRRAGEVLASNEGPWEKLEAYFQFGREICGAGDKICPIGALHAGYASFPEPMQRAVSAFTAEQDRWFALVLTEGKRAGVFDFPGTPESQAVLLSAAMQGALQRARACGDPALYDAAVEQLKATMKPAAQERSRKR